MRASDEYLQDRADELEAIAAEYPVCHWTADEAIRQYKYWADRSHEIAENPKLGRDTESYRAAHEMSARWLGRYDVLAWGAWSDV